MVGETSREHIKKLSCLLNVNQAMKKLVVIHIRNANPNYPNQVTWAFIANWSNGTPRGHIKLIQIQIYSKF